jgi:hypothetical protein
MVMRQTDDLAVMKHTAQRLIRALDTQDADAIIVAAHAVHQSVQAIAAQGAWHVDAPRSQATLYPILDHLMMLVRAAEYRVRFLTDYGQRRVTQLTQAGANTPANASGLAYRS